MEGQVKRRSLREQCDVPGLPETASARPAGALGIIDIFVLTTLVALAAAVAAPFFQALDRQEFGYAVTTLTLQLTLVVATVVYLCRQRGKAISLAGMPLARVYVGTFRWRHWPLVFALTQLTGLAAAQLVVAYAMSQTNNSYYSAINWIQTSLFSGYVVARYMWRAFPCTIELFENGVISGSTFLSWSECDVRNSTIYPGRIVIVLKSKDLKDTLVAHASEDLRNELKRLEVLSASGGASSGQAKNAQLTK
ncbi:MAG: hypothetical protein Aurels2KO_03360 [Aureliella sp.]